MAFFQGTNGEDFAAGGQLIGFTGGSSAELQDNIGDDFRAGDGADFVQAGNGNDEIIGEGGNDNLKGGGGDDELEGGIGTDSLSGEAGNDTFFMSEDEEIDDVSGGDGIDTLDFADAFATGVRGMNADLAAGVWSMSDGFGGTRSISGIEVVLGTRASDTVNGGAANETITGNGGVDNLNGGDGDDRFIMSEKSSIDDVNGGNGNDTLDLSKIVNFGADIDSNSYQLIGGLGGTQSLSNVEIILGTQANDTVFGSDNSDTIRGNNGDDRLNGLLGRDSLDGGSGNDTFVMNDGAFIDSVDGGSGINTLDLSNITSRGANIDLAGGTWDLSPSFGGPATIDDIDTVIGTQRNDRIVTDINTQTLIGGAGNDTFVMISTDIVVDNVDGGNGLDRLDLSAVTARGADINLTTGLWELANVVGNPETIENVEIIVGTQVNDTVVGSAVGETMFGGLGVDRLTGAGGNDVLTGGAGRDILNGGGGLDRFDFNALGESGKTSATRDSVSGFTHLQDDLDFSTIDARAGQAGNQAFSFIGGAAFTAEGQIRAVQVGADTILEVNTTGGSGAEMTIELSNFLASTLSGVDFIL